ncbi:amidohydrolase [Sediminibacterium soli]|uniref:amidohydrolase n=1 Tax=Sediminibacterium soli TaxID=2698829 RepID=UPI001379EACF|nr:amidohydrolase [Sediminibacterium soli]NCI46428.1 deaminase [Sediminibacterium soli]
MKRSGMPRKDFLKKSGLGLAGMAFAPRVLPSEKNPASGTDRKNTAAGADYVLKNVRLETGFDYEDGEVIRTRTELFEVSVSNGKIAALRTGNPAGGSGIDAKDLLLLPAFRDMHIHLDKTFYGGQWQAARRRTNGVKGMIALEQQILPGMLTTSTSRAEKLIGLLQSKGSSYARSHVNIEPTSKLQSLLNLQKALANKKPGFGAELVAFPQHGVFYTESVPYLKEAARMDIDFIGGLDPFSIDGAIEKTMDFTVQLALDHDKGIDIHLHETGESGLKTVEYLIKKVNENPALKNRTFISHCFVLGKLEQVKQEAIAEQLAAAGIGIVSTIPIGNLVMPIPVLYKHRVTVLTGNDSIIDHWNTFGSGSVLQKANLMAQLYGYNTEFLLSRSLRLATGNLLPLDDKGIQQWPKPGDAASMVLVDARCSAEAVSRVSPVKSLINNGHIVY